MQYNHYFEEWNTPPAGIDTISIYINPAIINRFNAFHEHGNIHEAINCRIKQEKDYRTGQLIRTNHIIDIQAEAINPDMDILGQIINILAGFVYDGTLKTITNADMPTLVNFFMGSFSSFFSIDTLDFYFDMKDGDSISIGKSDPRYPNTRYSSERYSSLKTYSKVKRQEYKNHISREHIQEMEFQNRIEFHLMRGNCEYLDYRNLQGPFEVVFLRYLPLLARKWFDHRREIVEVPNLKKLPYAHHLRQIDDIAHAGHIPHYRELLKTPPKPMPERYYKKDEVDRNWLPHIVTR
jgi:hypothetical protein